MEDWLIDEAIFRQKSEVEKIPFHNLIAQAVLEKILWKIYKSEYADIFLLKNSIEIFDGTYKDKVNRKICFCLKETENFLYKKKEIGCIFAKLFRNIKKECVHWNYSLTEIKMENAPGNKYVIYANMIATVFSTPIPLEISMEKCRKENMYSVQKDIIFNVGTKTKLKIHCYSGEEIVVEKFLNIMNKLELLSDLSDYMVLYCNLKSETLSGRRVSEILLEVSNDYGIELKQQRFDILLSYKNNKYMMKKWKSYLRREKIKEPEWEETMGLIEKFFGNVWLNLCQNVIYLGDWIPELGRFID